MFNVPAVFVVGAGASAEFSLPAGAELKEKIARGVHFRFQIGSQIDGDFDLLDVLKRHFDNKNDKVNVFTQAGSDLSETISTFPSIDEALHWWRARPEIVELGKLAIAHYILEAERKSPLAAKVGQINVRDASGTWLETFLSMAVSANDRDRVGDIFQNVTFINFNYDRIIEQYLYWGLQQLAGVNGEAAASAISNLKMIRPYGSIGPLNIELAGGIAKDAVPFGGGRRSDLFLIAKNIQTFTEQSEDLEISSLIDDVIEAASLVIFLGFGFHQQNLALFRPGVGRARANARAVMASVFGIDRLNYKTIENHLESDIGLKAPKSLVPVKANQLLSNLRLSIAMAVG